MLRLGENRDILRVHLQRRLLYAGADAARARHPGGLRSAQERYREALRARAHGAARDGDDGLRMDSVFRLMLRFILVPFGYLAAVIVGACIILFGSWHLAEVLVSRHPDAATYGLFGFAI